MHKLETIFGELLKLVPRYQFEKAVKLYQGDRYVKSYTTWHQYITILFSQIKRKDSIRDIITGLDAHEWLFRPCRPVDPLMSPTYESA